MNKVFLVDDDYYVRKGLLELIDWNSCGYEICGEAGNGEDGFELIKEKKPDLVVTDIRMPVLDGLGLIKNIVELTDLNTNFIIVSGYNDFKYAQKALRYGVHDFILKPIDKEEFESTLIELSKEINNRKKMERQREMGLAISTLEQVLSGVIDPAEKEYIKMLRLSNVLEMRYILIEVNDNKLNASEILKVMQKEIQMVTQYENPLIKEHEQDRFGILITDKQLHLFGGDINRFSQRFQNVLEKKLNHKVTIYIGKLIKQFDKIRQSYKTAKEALQYKYALATNEPINYDDVQTLEINYIKLEQSFFDRLVEHVIEKKTDEIKESIDEMFNEFQLNMFARDAVKTTINRCVHEVIRLIKVREGNEYELPHLPKMLVWDEKPLTIDQIKDIFSNFVLAGSEYVFKLNQDKIKGDIYKIREYIENHYHENLTLKSIADKFYMNPAYLGQLFRKTYGVYFRDYFRQVRINEAKKRLRQTDMRVYEIADDIGFENPDYFVTQFRKEVGMTPMNYRKKVRKKLSQDKDLDKDQDGDNHEAVSY